MPGRWERSARRNPSSFLETTARQVGFVSGADGAVDRVRFERRERWARTAPRRSRLLSVRDAVRDAVRLGCAGRCAGWREARSVDWPELETSCADSSGFVSSVRAERTGFVSCGREVPQGERTLGHGARLGAPWVRGLVRLGCAVWCASGARLGAPGRGGRRFSRCGCQRGASVLRGRRGTRSGRRRSKGRRGTTGSKPASLNLVKMGQVSHTKRV